MSDFEEQFTLSQTDKVQSLWLRLKAHLEHKLDVARRKNDYDMSEAQTAMLRGEIKSLKAIIGLGNDRPVVTGNEDAP